MDPTGMSVAAAGTLRTGATTPAGDKISVGCLVRIEANPTAGAYRLTVRAVHRDVSLATKNCLKLLLA
jgi:AP-2 complex subunit alpha